MVNVMIIGWLRSYEQGFCYINIICVYTVGAAVKYRKVRGRVDECTNHRLKYGTFARVSRIPI